MKYEKGTFTVVPNREALRGLPAGAQALYLWLCSYADEYGECYPSRGKLAKDIGATVKTVDTHLRTLEDTGLITKTERVQDNVKQSNLYQLQLVEGRVKITPRREKNSPRGRVKNDTRVGKKTTYRTITTELKPLELNTLALVEDKTIGLTGEYLNVKLSPKDYNDLTNQIGQEALDDLIEQLSRYIVQQGKDPYKGETHRATIQTWASRRKDELSKKYKTFSVIG